MKKKPVITERPEKKEADPEKAGLESLAFKIRKSAFITQKASIS